MIFIIVIISITYFLRYNHPYFKEDIYRFDFLPPYDELVTYLERIKRGEITMTDVAISAGKKVLGKSGTVASTGLTMAMNKFAGLFKGKREENEE